MTTTKSKSVRLVLLEERLKWAYQGSMYNNGRINWNEVNRLEAKIAKLSN
jgi:hypothetical protein